MGVCPSLKTVKSVKKNLKLDCTGARLQNTALNIATDLVYEIAKLLTNGEIEFLSALDWARVDLKRSETKKELLKNCEFFGKADSIETESADGSTLLKQGERYQSILTFGTRYISEKEALRHLTGKEGKQFTLRLLEIAASTLSGVLKCLKETTSVALYAGKTGTWKQIITQSSFLSFLKDVKLNLQKRDMPVLLYGMSTTGGHCAKYAIESSAGKKD